ncbi:MAG: hypothetical protein WC900_03595, partial [Oscillospiraceae bacterium]
DQNIAGNTVPVSTWIVCTAKDSTTSATQIGGVDVDLKKGLGTGGTEFKGWWGFMTNTDGTGVTFALYCKSGDVSPFAAPPVQLTKKNQEDAVGQNVIGCNPLA